MLEGVADVDWAELGAAEVPDLLRAIPDAATALDAWWELDRRLGQTGSWQSIDEDRMIRGRAEAALASVTGRPATTSALPSRTALA
jgi:hypothetical protein